MQRGPRGHPADPAVREHAEPHRPHEPGPAGADHRHPRDPRVRARAGRGSAFRDRQRRPHPELARRRAPPGVHVPERDAGPEPVERRRGLVRRRPGGVGRHADRHADRVPHLPDPDPHRHDDGHVRRGDVATCRGVRGARQRGARHPAERGRTHDSGARDAAAGDVRDAQRELQLPRCRGAGAQRHLLPGQPRRVARGGGQHRCGQDDAARARPAALRLHRRLGPGERGRRPFGRSRDALEPHRARAAEAVPVLGHGREQSPVRAGGSHRRRAVGGTRGRAGARLRRLDARRARRADRAGRHERLGRAASASRHRAARW